MTISKYAAALAVAASLAAAPSLAQTAAMPAAPPASAAPAAPAVQPSQTHLDAARQLMDLTGVLGSVDDMLPTFAREIRQQNITRPDLGKDLDIVLKGLEPEMQLQRAQVYGVVARSYAKFFTEDELRQLITFFKSPLGAKFLKTQPALVDEVTDEVTAWSQQVSEYVMVRTRAEMTKRGQQMN